MKIVPTKTKKIFNMIRRCRKFAGRLAIAIENILFKVKRGCFLRSPEASERILKNMHLCMLIIRVPMDSLKAFGPSGFDPAKIFSKLSVSQPIR